MKLADLPVIMTNASKRLALLNSKYPRTWPYLVLQEPRGKQVESWSDKFQLLIQIPNLFRATPDRKAALDLLDRLPKNKGRPDLHANPTLTTKLGALIDDLELSEATQVEIRFSELDYDAIAKMQVDPLVDQTLTPQGRASIRIVLGDLFGLWDGVGQ